MSGCAPTERIAHHTADGKKQGDDGVACSMQRQLQRKASLRWQKRTIFPTRGLCEKEFGVQAGNDQDESDADSDEIRRYELPSNGLMIVSRGANGRTRHVVLPASLIWRLGLGAEDGSWGL